MTFNILLYGATGHSGEEIAKRAAKEDLTGCRLILAGRDSLKLEKVAGRLGMTYRAFQLDDRRAVMRHLVGIDLVVNAAGPFALTADRLAKAALEAECSYLDINGELDVYLQMDDLARKAHRQRVSIVSSAGHTAAASCLLLQRALDFLKYGDPPKSGSITDATSPAHAPQEEKARLGAIRIALSLPPEYSRGSAVTALRLVREQVLTIRRGTAMDADGDPMEALVKWHEPVGRLDRAFDFGDLRRAGERASRGSIRMATAANLVDTVVALELVERGKWEVDSIESYLAMNLPARATYQLASTLSSLAVLPPVAAQLQGLANFLVPERPSAAAGGDQQVVVLEIDNAWHERVIDWRLTVPSASVSLYSSITPL
jgi:hypothetical protein